MAHCCHPPPLRGEGAVCLHEFRKEPAKLASVGRLDLFLDYLAFLLFYSSAPAQCPASLLVDEDARASFPTAACRSLLAGYISHG